MSARRTRLASRTGAALLAAAVLVSSAQAEAPDASSKPAWLRAPAAHGPLAATFALDDRLVSWTLDTNVPIGMSARTRDAPGPLASEAPRLRLGALLSSTHAIADDEPAGHALRYTMLLDRSGAHAGGWLGVSSGEERASGAPLTRLRLATGAWRALRPIEVEGSLISSLVRFRNDPRWTRQIRTRIWVGPDTLPWNYRDTTFIERVDHAAVWTMGQGALRWRRGRLELETMGGITVGEGAPLRRWAQGTVRMQLSRRVLLSLSQGQRPQSSLAFDASAQPRTMIGVQLAPWSTSQWAMAAAVHPVARAWFARRDADGRMLLHVRTRDAHRVELAGDFTDWLAAELTPIGGGWWRIAVPIEPGLHHVQVRLDGGAWQVPPGLPRSSEGFDGPIGLLLTP